MAPQAAILEQSLAVGLVNLQVVQHGLVGLGLRASQPVHFKRPHRVSDPLATTLQFTRLVKKANADPRGNFLLFESKRASRDYRGGLLCQRLGLDGIRGFCQLAGSLLHSELRQQRATASPALWTALRGGRMVRRCWVNFQCWGVLLIWIIVGQGPVALAVGAGRGCLDIFSLICPFSPLSPSLWETARYRLKYCLKGPLNPKQPTCGPLTARKGVQPASG